MLKLKVDRGIKLFSFMSIYECILLKTVLSGSKLMYEYVDNVARTGQYEKKKVIKSL